jgi:hypothetical protein
MKSLPTIGICIAGATLVASSASAQTRSANHPLRSEVNSRLANQNARIAHGVADGQLSQTQAVHLRNNDRAVRGEERLYAFDHNGHISPGAQARFNRQESRNSRAIWAERH